MVVEVMGRHAGHIAAWSGMAGGADVILVPEYPFEVEEVCDHLRRRHGNGQRLGDFQIDSRDGGQVRPSAKPRFCQALFCQM